MIIRATAPAIVNCAGNPRRIAPQIDPATGVCRVMATRGWRTA
jgi:hypothetical protein